MVTNNISVRILAAFVFKTENSVLQPPSPLFVLSPLASQNQADGVY